MNRKPANRDCAVRAYGRSGNGNAGVGLIEILIAVLVLSIGLLGIAALQVHALANNNDSMAQSMATVASYSILDAMRADRSDALAGLYNVTVTADQCPAPGSLVQTQLHNWCVSLGTALGAVATTQGQINCSASGDCTILVQYQNDKTAPPGASKLQTFTTRAML